MGMEWMMQAMHRVKMSSQPVPSLDIAPKSDQ
jgi:hypothetical protein